MDTLTKLNTALLFLEGKLIFHTIPGFTRGGGRAGRRKEAENTEVKRLLC